MRTTTSLAAFALACALGAICLDARAAPEDHGALDVMTFSVASVPVAGGATVPVKVYYSPSLSAPAPIVGVIHGNLRNGSYHAELATTLATRGFIAVVPDMPCGLSGCNHDANAEDLIALLDWAVMQGQSSSSPIFGKVDGSRRGLIGHSWGGLNTFLAAVRGAPIQSLVLFDPNDDRSAASQAAASMHVPSILIAAEVIGACNATLWSQSVYPSTPAPRMRIRVKRSGHCDAEEPTDSLCPIPCGSGDHSTSPIFRRYAVAWTGCILQNDAAMAPYVGGAAVEQDEAAMIVDNREQMGLDTLPCRGGASIGDGGAAGGGEDAAASAPDAGGGGPLDGSIGETGSDAGSPSGGAADAAVSSGDAGTATGSGGDAGALDAGGSAGAGGKSSGCTCAPVRPGAGSSYALAIVMAIGLVFSRRGSSPRAFRDRPKAHHPPQGLRFECGLRARRCTRGRALFRRTPGSERL
jgi:dienelactone hydrolase